MLTDLKEIISIDTTLAPRSAVDAPFGQNLRNALDWFLNKASSYGLKVGEDNGYCGWADYGDSDKPIIGILCHADIVPCGEGWDTDPLTLTEKDGNLYGRGITDDKGALVVALHLLKRLREENIKLNHRVRLIVGLNEESGSACIKHYVKRQEIPVVSLVPDSDFPVINSEKGILHALCSIAVSQSVKDNLFSFSSGVRPNVVPDKAFFTVSKAYYDAITSASHNLTDKDFSVEHDGDNYRFTTFGVSGHACAPENSDNAIYKAFTLLSFADEFFVNLRNDFASYDCSLYKKLFVTDKSGALTFNVGIVAYDGAKLDLTYDFRLPLCLNYETVISSLKAHYDSVSVLQYSPNLYVSEDSTLIKTLLSVYRSVTRDNRSKPLQIGGGTYARELPNAVAFGPTFGLKILNIHSANEFMPVADLQKFSEIYYKAVLALDKAF
ncbi:MAG: Sapep family Mn(2+)-dependent dipeptidase [Clostridia bacterium]|nr:Sapep family Mn(2+)-dependent dipeptidase [Clostridia bacterium]